jgi:hypothetical protein
MSSASADLTGIWLSEYEYESTTRGGPFKGRHHVAVTQHAESLQVHSLPASRSQLVMDLTVKGRVVMGTWLERTDPDGHYAGAVYIGTVLMVLAPDGNAMSGKWTGGSKDLTEVNTGPWTLTLLEPSEDGAARERWDREPE